MMHDQNAGGPAERIFTLPDVGTAGERLRVVKWDREIGHSVCIGEKLVSLRTEGGRAIDVLSPWYGSVTKRHTDIAALVSIGDPIATIAPDSKGEAALASILNTVDRVVRDHGEVLVRKMRQKTHRDDYGRLVDTEWKREIEYFHSNIVASELDVHCAQDIHVSASIFAMLSMPVVLREALGCPDVQYYIDERVRLRINDGVKDLERLLPASPAMADGMSAQEYEHLCASEVQAGGWQARVNGGVGDQGADIIAERGGLRAVIQCKLYSAPVGNAAVQEVFASRSFYQASLAVVVSSADFTPASRALAKQTGVVLIHHSELRALFAGLGSASSSTPIVERG